MNENSLKSISVSLVLLLTFLFNSCGEKTEEDLILELVKDIGRFAEKKDVNSLMTLLTEDYADFEGRGKSEAKKMAEGYFRQYRGIAST